ncbi:MAG: ATP-binding protein, partial [Caldilineaceae bacterium]|nr:ATP-binding protein [Caldilineaceae bacterium]
MRIFNTTGPVRPEQHYCLPPLERFNLNDVMFYIDQGKYFVLHAPRQVGKTTYLLALMDYLNAQERYRCLYINVEAAQAMREDVEAAMRVILWEIASQAQWALKDPYPESVRATILEQAGANALNALISRWAQQSDKPLILLLDEIDSLVGDTLISVLRQLRAGYTDRPAAFPQNIILCGVRDVRDYRIHSTVDKAVITGGSAFNIKVTSLRLGNFNQQEVEQLYQQHTGETGQIFTPDAMQLIWELTEGQPWLVNALGYEICFTNEAARSYRGPVSAALVNDAKEAIIRR